MQRLFLHLFDMIHLLAQTGEDTDTLMFGHSYMRLFTILIVCFALQLQTDVSEINV